MRRLIVGTVIAGLIAAAGLAPALGADTVTLTKSITSDWTTGFCADVRVTTNATKAFTWSAPFDPQGSITSLWSAQTAGSPGSLTVSGLSWNSTISASSPTTFGYCATRTAPVTPTPSQSTTAPTPSLTPTPTETAAGGITLALVTRTEWTSGRTIDATVTSAVPTTSWTVSFASGMTISDMWSATNQSASGTIKAANATWNGKLAAGASTTFGFTGSGAKENYTGCTATVNGSGVPCALGGVVSTPTASPSPTASSSPSVTASQSPTVTPSVSPTATPTPIGDMKIVGYYPGWATYGRNYQVTDIPATKLTHINYAFANISGGKCVVGDSYADTEKVFPGDSTAAGAPHGNYNQLNKLKAANPGLKSLISVGGWTWSTQFSSAALTDASRKTFADSCVALMRKYGFDGIDIDWEYPVSGGLQNGLTADKQNFTLLLQALNAALDAQGAADGRDYLLTIAAPAGADKVNNIEPAKVAATVDWINLMTYDYNGNWNSYTGHNAPLTKPTGDPGPAGLYAQATVNNYLAKGVPASKLILGVPFYGRSWSNVPVANNGLFQSGTTGPGTWEAGMLDYKDIAANYLTNPAYEKFRDDSAQVPYLFNKSTGVFVTYDDPASIQAKAEYVHQEGLGGAMIWELSADTKDGALLNSLRMGLGR